MECSVPLSKLCWPVPADQPPALDTYPASYGLVKKLIDGIEIGEPDWAEMPATGGFPSHLIVLNAAQNASRLAVENLLTDYPVQAFVQPGDSNWSLALNRIVQRFRDAGLPGQISFPAGEFEGINPFAIDMDGIKIKGIPGQTIFKRSAARGNGFETRQNNVIIEGITFDCDDSPIEGGFWLSGNENTVRLCEVRNGDATSFVVSGVFSDGQQFNVVPTANNRVEFCIARGQKQYHAVGGKASFLAGDDARSTVFTYCYSYDCNGDAFDSDNAPDTEFLNCHAYKSGTLNPSAGFWTEGEQSNPFGHRVTLFNCTATNFLIGFGCSEKAKVQMEGCKAFECVSGFEGLNNEFLLELTGCKAYKCGGGLSGSDTDGVFSFSGPAVMSHCYSEGTLAKFSVANYSGASLTNTTLTVEACNLDSSMQVAYENKGNQFIRIINTTFRDGVINWQQSDGTSTRQVFIDGLYIKGYIAGARIGRAVIYNSHFVAGNNTQTAVALNITQPNTIIFTSHFSGYAHITNYAESGFGITHDGIVNPPPAVSHNPSLYVQGTHSSRATFRTEATSDTPSGFDTINAAPGVTGYPADPFGINWWYRTRNHLAHPGGEYWTNDFISNLNGSYIGWRLRNGFDNTWYATIRALTTQAMSGLADGDLVQYDGSGFVNGLPKMRSKAGAPTASDIPASRYAVYKNTSDNSVKLWVNDGGTLKSVTLS